MNKEDEMMIKTVSKFGPEGMRIFSEVLQTNTTVIMLDLGGKLHKHYEKWNCTKVDTSNREWH